MSDRAWDREILRVTRILPELSETVVRVVNRTFARVLNLNRNHEGFVNSLAPWVREDDQHVRPTPTPTLLLLVYQDRPAGSVLIAEPLRERIQELGFQRHVWELGDPSSLQSSLSRDG